MLQTIGLMSGVMPEVPEACVLALNSRKLEQKELACVWWWGERSRWVPRQDVQIT